MSWEASRRNNELRRSSSLFFAASEMLQQILALQRAFHKCNASPAAVESFTDVSCMDFVEFWHGVERFLVSWINLG